MHRYLFVVPVAFVPLTDGRAAVESAFAEHLRMLLDSLGPTVQEIEVVAPALAADSDTRGLGILDPDTDRIRFVAAYPTGIGRLAYWLALPRLVARLWRAVGGARFVHAGPSSLYRPFENVALLFGWFRRRVTIYVTDIDERQSPRMRYLTGQWSWGVYVRARFVHQQWENAQHHIARWICSILLLKGQALVRDFGRGRANVHYILDSAFSRDMLLTADEQLTRWARMADASRSLCACYFGRLVAYKGVDRMLQAVAGARARGADVTLDVYGGGDQERALRSLAESLGVQESVRFCGVRAYGPEFFRELADFDVLLAAPLSEDTPRSALDAQALGMPILAFDTYYYRELAEMGAGVRVVTWPDAAALGEQLVELSRERSALVELGRRGITFAEQNTQESWLARRAQWTLAAAGKR